MHLLRERFGWQSKLTGVAEASATSPGPYSQAMSQNVDIIRNFYEALARDEFPAELIDSEVEYVNPVGAVEAGTRHGLTAFRRAVEKVFEGWETWQMEPEELTAVGNQVAAVVRYRAVGRTSGVALEGRESALFTLGRGRVVRYEWFHEPADALRAAGSVQPSRPPLKPWAGE
jgi:ketosteroid isomerase-like protein